jgi:hypothetical protein
VTDYVKIAEADLPPSTKGVLLSGLPQHIVFPDDISPTLFTNAIVDGQLREIVSGYVVGSIRERQVGNADLSLFVLGHGTGVVSVVDNDEDVPRFVNANLETFFTCLAVLLQGLGSDGFRQTIERVDSETSKSEYWIGWIDELRGV